MVFVMAAQAHTVYVRNEIMRYQKIFWEDNVRKEPHLSRPRSALSKVYFDEGDFEKGARESNMALQLGRYPNYIQPALYHCTLGNYYLLIKKNDDQASFHYQQALKFQPNHMLAYNGLALVMLKKGLVKQADDYIRQAIRYKPDDPSYHLNLARILLKEGHYGPALIEAETATKLRGGNYHEAYAVMAEAFHRQGNLNRAIYYWEKYLVREPANFEGRLALIELYSLANKRDLLLQSIGIIITLKGKDGLRHAIEEAALKKDAVYVPVTRVILPIIRKELNAIIPELAQKQQGGMAVHSPLILNQ
jgi:tetratricopeptide (TPR) repeat protein